jgi:hypothetical protein
MGWRKYQFKIQKGKCVEQVKISAWDAPFLSRCIEQVKISAWGKQIIIIVIKGIN